MWIIDLKSLHTNSISTTLVITYVCTQIDEYVFKLITILFVFTLLQVYRYIGLRFLRRYVPLCNTSGVLKVDAFDCRETSNIDRCKSIIIYGSHNSSRNWVSVAVIIIAGVSFVHTKQMLYIIILRLENTYIYIYDRSTTLSTHIHIEVLFRLIS